MHSNASLPDAADEMKLHVRDSCQNSLADNPLIQLLDPVRLAQLLRLPQCGTSLYAVVSQPAHATADLRVCSRVRLVGRSVGTLKHTE